MNHVETKEKIKKTLIQEIEKMSDDELVKIENNTHEVKIRIEKIKNKEKRISSLTEDVMKDYEKKLSDLANREEGVELLTTLLKDKLSAEYFAKYLCVSFLKQDNKEYIINKIVEATIGAKLRSLAIKGK